MNKHEPESSSPPGGNLERKLAGGRGLSVLLVVAFVALATGFVLLNVMKSGRHGGVWVDEPGGDDAGAGKVEKAFADGPFLPSLPSRQGGATANYDEGGNLIWEGEIAADAQETVTAHVLRRTTPYSEKSKGRYESVYPEGTWRTTVALKVGGWPALGRIGYVTPAGAEFPQRPRWDLARVILPDGRGLEGDSLGVQSGSRNFSPWNFLDVVGTHPAMAKPFSWLKPSLTGAVAAHEGAGWGACEVVLERPVSDTATIRTSIRIKRVAGDPYLYMLITTDPAGGAVEQVRLAGFPGTAHPVIYGIRPEYPSAVKYLERQRWVWAAGEDWNMHDREVKHEMSPMAEAPSGVFWYNRLNSETGGMMAVFLPEEIAALSAAGTYGVSATFALRGASARFALLEWSDWRGWEERRAVFEERLPGLQKSLRGMTFAWPLDDPLGQVARHHAVHLASDQSLPAKERAALATALRDYDAARSALAGMPLTETSSRFAAERTVLLGAAAVETAMTPLQKAWVKAGGPSAVE